MKNNILLAYRLWQSGCSEDDAREIMRAANALTGWNWNSYLQICRWKSGKDMTRFPDSATGTIGWREALKKEFPTIEDIEQDY